MFPMSQINSLVLATKYFMGEGRSDTDFVDPSAMMVITSDNFMATSGILHVPVTGQADDELVSDGPTYVTSITTDPSLFDITLVVELGKPAEPVAPASEPNVFPSSEPQAERKNAKDAIARKFFMFRALLRHSFPLPERGVKFFFVRTESSEGKKHFFKA